VSRESEVAANETPGAGAAEHARLYQFLMRQGSTPAGIAAALASWADAAIRTISKPAAHSAMDDRANHQAGTFSNDLAGTAASVDTDFPIACTSNPIVRSRA
jgi:hypothetical protein